MYSYNVRQALFAALRSDPVLSQAKVPDGVKLLKIKDARLRRVAERLLSELWHMGFTVSARTPGELATLDRSDHDAWRATKSKLPPGAPRKPQDGPPAP